MEDTMHGIGSHLADYLLSPSAVIAVVIPGMTSLIILTAYLYASRVSGRLWLLWAVCLPITFGCGHWVHRDDLHELYLVSAFSIACLLLLFRKMYVPPALTYALTFLSLGVIDAAQAFRHALEFGLPISTFYYGIGGAGIADALFIVPLATAAFALYAAARLKAQHASLVNF